MAATTSYSSTGILLPTSSIHSRDAAKDTLDMMKAAKAGDIGGVVHCFSYTREMARDRPENGSAISFQGPFMAWPA